MEFLLISLALAAGYVFSSLRVLKQYERGVVFFLGKYTNTKGPGLIFVPTLFARMKRHLVNVELVKWAKLAKEANLKAE